MENLMSEKNWSKMRACYHAKKKVSRLENNVMEDFIVLTINLNEY